MRIMEVDGEWYKTGPDSNLSGPIITRINGIARHVSI